MKNYYYYRTYIKYKCYKVSSYRQLNGQDRDIIVILRNKYRLSSDICINCRIAYFVDTLEVK